MMSSAIRGSSAGTASRGFALQDCTNDVIQANNRLPAAKVQVSKVPTPAPPKMGKRHNPYTTCVFTPEFIKQYNLPEPTPTTTLSAFPRGHGTTPTLRAASSAATYSAQQIHSSTLRAEAPPFVPPANAQMVLPSSIAVQRNLFHSSDMMCSAHEEALMLSPAPQPTVAAYTIARESVHRQPSTIISEESPEKCASTATATATAPTTTKKPEPRQHRSDSPAPRAPSSLNNTFNTPRRGTSELVDGNTATTTSSSTHRLSVSSLAKRYVDGRPIPYSTEPLLAYAEVIVRFSRSEHAFVVRDMREVLGDVRASELVGRNVVVTGDRGVDLGTIITVTRSETSMPDEADMNTTLPSVLREATPEEISSLQQLRESEEEAVRYCREQARTLLGDDDVIVVEHAVFQFDKQKLTFGYRSDAYVDFVQLLRVLNRMYHCRIWMDQLQQTRPTRNNSSDKNHDWQSSSNGKSSAQQRSKRGGWNATEARVKNAVAAELNNDRRGSSKKQQKVVKA